MAGASSTFFFSSRCGDTLQTDNHTGPEPELLFHWLQLPGAVFVSAAWSKMGLGLRLIHSLFLRVEHMLVAVV